MPYFCPYYWHPCQQNEMFALVEILFWSLWGRPIKPEYSGIIKTLFCSHQVHIGNLNTVLYLGEVKILHHVIYDSPPLQGIDEIHPGWRRLRWILAIPRSFSQNLSDLPVDVNLTSRKDRKHLPSIFLKNNNKKHPSKENIASSFMEHFCLCNITIEYQLETWGCTK